MKIMENNWTIIPVMWTNYTCIYDNIYIEAGPGEASMKYKPEGLEAKLRGGIWSELNPTKVERKSLSKGYKNQKISKLSL